MNDLRERFLSPPEGSRPQQGCPGPDVLWRAVRSELPSSEFEHVVMHVGSCPACTVAFNLARQIHLDSAPAARDIHPAADDMRWPRWAAVAAAAALLILAGVVATGRLTPGRPAAVFRSSASSEIRSLLPDGAPLPRDGFVLRWSAGPSGCTYTIRVTDEALAPIIETRHLDATEYRVDPARLERLPDGSRILWQVEAAGASGYRIVSPTFSTRIE